LRDLLPPPTRRSSDLLHVMLARGKPRLLLAPRLAHVAAEQRLEPLVLALERAQVRHQHPRIAPVRPRPLLEDRLQRLVAPLPRRDRKSPRLSSSHVKT